MKKRWMTGMVCMFVVAALALTGVAAAGNVGSEEDPLITYSYLNETFKDEVLAEANGGFVLVVMNRGQVLYGDIGTEVMLRVGTAVCTASSTPGLIDTTSASTINDGAALEKNHLYMMTIEERGIKATADTVKILVRGGYSIA